MSRTPTSLAMLIVVLGALPLAPAADTPSNLPILLAGSGGGTITTGRHVRYEKETPLNNLFLSMLDRMESSVEALGDSNGRAEQLT